MIGPVISKLNRLYQALKVLAVCINYLFFRQKTIGKCVSFRGWPREGPRGTIYYIGDGPNATAAKENR